MPVHNSDIADTFDEIADLLEIGSGNPFRIRAYRNASRAVRNWPTSLSVAVKEGQSLPKIPGVGKDLQEKIVEITQTQKLALLDQLERETPEGLRELLRLPGVGPKRVKKLQMELGVHSTEDLIRVLEKGSLGKIGAGFGPKIEQKIRDELQRLSGLAPSERNRILLADAEQVGEPLLAFLMKTPGAKQGAIAGSFRRRLETVGDLDILISCKDGSKVMERFLGYEDVRETVAKGDTRSTVILRSGIQVDLRTVPEDAFGAALHYFTGSKNHNIAVRTLGVRAGLKMNEYGIFKGTKRIGGLTEKEVFRSVGLPYIEPELRENQGEIEAAREGKLPALLTLEQIRGDLHAHTKATDGRLSIGEMAAAAQSLGYEYLAITDHSRRLSMTHGFDERRLAAQIREIDRINSKMKGFRILKSIEVDILEGGQLDLPNSILSQLDLTVCSVHSYFDLPQSRQTERVLRAMDNPYFHILGHPTGRLLGQRPPIELDVERLMRAARDRGVMLELNAQPERMDLSSRYCRLAKEMGVLVVISTDAHSDHDLHFMKFGVDQARRAWLGPDDVLNTRPWAEIEKLLTRRPARAAA